MSDFTVNSNRLEQRGLDELRNAIDLRFEILQRQNFLTDEGKAVLDIVTVYARSWRMLLEYDTEVCRTILRTTPRTHFVKFFSRCVRHARRFFCRSKRAE